MAEESPKQRVDRELIELLNEIRIALPGVQVLFAFLLVVPFQQGFSQVTDTTRYVYFAGLASSAIAILFFIAPATYHRLNLRRGVAEKEEMLFKSSRLVLIGTAFLGLGIVCSLFVIADVLFGDAVAWTMAIVVAVAIVLLWYGLPLLSRRPGGLDAEPTDQSETKPSA
jgi:amino acid transporter